MSCNKDEINSSFEEHPELARYAALLRPFLAPSSKVELNFVWKNLLNSGLVEKEKQNSISEAIKASEKLPISFQLNGSCLGARDIYFAYAEGFFFGDNEKAKELLRQFPFKPMQDMLKSLFYLSCDNFSKLVFLLLDIILDLERSHPELIIHKELAPNCIYCLTQSSDFKSEEHIIPEALGIDEFVLENAVCSNCNNRLSFLDQYLAEFEPLAFLRVFYVPLTKKGKFPRADFQEFKIEKVKPREIILKSKLSKGVVETEELPNGKVKINLKATGRKRFNPIRLARSLFKVSLGFVAYDAGREFACSTRYNAARDFINGKCKFPNNLLIARSGKPNYFVKIWWKDLENATIVALDFYGVQFLLNLEPTPLNISIPNLSEVIAEFWLGEDFERRREEVSS